MKKRVLLALFGGASNCNICSSGGVDLEKEQKEPRKIRPISDENVNNEQKEDEIWGFQIPKNGEQHPDASFNHRAT